MKYIVESFNEFRVVLRQERDDGNVTHFEVPRDWMEWAPEVGKQVPIVTYLGVVEEDALATKKLLTKM